MLDYVIEQTEKYIGSKPKSERKHIGQFFTSKETAKYMTGLFNIPSQNEIYILDPGAGTGILTAALIDKLQTRQDVKRINLTCYENEAETAAILRSNLEHIVEISSVPLTFKIIEENYITSQSDNFNQTILANEKPAKFDLVIGNPPYKKIPKDAKEAAAMPAVCYGAPNLYFLFSAMSLYNLKDGGELVYIIPRSWTSGAYFKAFRDYFLLEGKIETIHLFVSRDKVFDRESVLQETMIIKMIKQRSLRESILITGTQTNADFENITSIEAPYSAVVSHHENYVFLATDLEQLNTLETLNKFEDTLPTIGIRMKTGLTVDFRNYEVLREAPGEGVVPLYYAQHIKDGRVVFPVGKEHEYIITEQAGLVQKNRNYLFVKRFTAKEEKRRLQCGIYLSSDQPEYQLISTQNKINFIDTLNGEGLSVETVYGLFVLFNSTIYDTYYRILNGSTQVNSTEMNAMPVPPLNTIISNGKKLMESNDLSVKNCDSILKEALLLAR